MSKIVSSICAPARRRVPRARAPSACAIAPRLTRVPPSPAQAAVGRKFIPLADRVLVKRVEEESKTKGGIIIPDSAKEKPQEGEVVSVGPGARDEDGKHVAMDLKAGDRILFGKWSGTEVKIDGEDLIIMKESDVLGVLS